MEVEKPITSLNLVPNVEVEKEDIFTSEFVRLRQILPEEIWKLVAGKLKTEDVESLTNSSAFFRNLLGSQRTTFLFEKVFPIVASAVWETKGLDGLPVSEVLKLRGVSKHWNAVIEKLVPEKFQHFVELSSGSEQVAWRKPIADAFERVLKPTSFSTEGAGSVHNFLRHFEGTHPSSQESKGRSPFIWGNVSVEIWADDEDDNDIEVRQRYLQNISTVLSKYGRYLDKFSLEIANFDDKSMLREWFLNLPNLKELKFHGDGHWENASWAEWEFPKLEHLETLNVYNIPGTLFNRLIRQASQISSSFIGFANEEFGNVYDFFTCPLPNLRKLQMTTWEVKDMEKLWSSQVQWPLESLTLDCCYDSDGWASSFQVIEDKFGDTLVSLDLQMIDCEDEDSELWDDWKTWRLELPNLKKIKLGMYDNPVYLDFLLPMRKNLEEISVLITYQRPPQKDGTLSSGTIVQFMGFEEKMLESNIWAIFKKLNKIEVTATWEDEDQLETRCYLREEWMENNFYN